MIYSFRPHWPRGITTDALLDLAKVPFREQRGSISNTFYYTSDESCNADWFLARKIGLQKKKDLTAQVAIS